MKSSQIIQALQVSEAANIPIMIWGSPGVGKSATVQQYAANNNKALFDIRLALLDPTDLRGIPFIDPETKTAKWGKASIFPTVNDGPSVLFLDEINAAPPSVQAAAYQLVLDRRIGEYELPEDCMIAAAGNRAGDRGVVHEMPSPLENRFTHLDFDVDKEDWVTWALNSRVHPDVISYIEHSPNSLNQFDPKNRTDHGFATPRSWSSVSKILFNTGSLTDINEKENVKVTNGLIKGTIGIGKGGEFVAFRKISSHLPNPMDILEGKTTKLPEVVKDEISAHYSMIISLVYCLNQAFDESSDNLNSYVSSYFKFLDNNMQPELNVLGVKTLQKTKKIKPLKYDGFTEFSNTYGKYF